MVDETRPSLEMGPRLLDNPPDHNAVASKAKNAKHPQGQYRTASRVKQQLKEAADA
jgi:hypothetical protein